MITRERCLCWTLLVLSLPVQAQSESKPLTLEDAVRKALTITKGYVQEARYPGSRGDASWYIQINVRLNRVAEVVVGRSSGTILHFEVEPGRTLKGKLDFFQAVEKARKQTGGELFFAEIDKGSDSLVWELKFKTADGKITYVEIDAMDGELVKISRGN